MEERFFLDRVDVGRHATAVNQGVEDTALVAAHPAPAPMPLGDPAVEPTELALHHLIDKSLFGLNNFQNTVPFAI